MFKLIVVLATLAVAVAFGPAQFRARSQIQMAAEQPSAAKVFGAAVVASSMMSLPAFAAVGDAPKQGFFSGSDLSSPFTVNENREDPIYSPYSPYGDGSAAVYNGRKGGKEEVAFYKTVFENAAKRTTKIPGFVAKKTWSEVAAELTRYNYNQREAMLRLAAASKDSAAATQVAKTYFADLNDVVVASKKKDAASTLAAYEKSVKDLATFQTLIK